MHSKSIIKRFPGYHGDLPFKLETGYVGIGKNEDIQLFYYFVESTRNPEQDPIIFYVPGGPGASGFLALTFEFGPLKFNMDNGQDNITLILNPNSWLQMANIIFLDIPAGSGYSYANTQEGWISSDSILVTQVKDFTKKFLMDHPMFLKNPLYVAGISYAGIVIPKITLEIYEDNERGDQPTLNIQCTRRLNLENILEPFCDENDPMSDCQDPRINVAENWANNEVVQQAFGVRQGKIGKWALFNNTLHYQQGKNDTECYAYDIFSSFAYHKKMSSKNCRALILSGDHDMTFPYVGVEQWIASLNLEIEIPWKPFYIDAQVGGYQMKYAQNDYSLTFTTVKGAGHIVENYKPKETMMVIKAWLISPSYSIDS